MGHHFPTVQNKAANSADSDGRLTIVQSIDLWRAKGSPSDALPLKLAAGKVRSAWNSVKVRRCWRPDVIDGGCTVLYGCGRRQAWWTSSCGKARKKLAISSRICSRRPRSTVRSSLPDIAVQLQRWC